MQKVNEKILFGCRLAILGFAIGFPGIACDPPEEAGDDASSTGTAEETGREGDSTGGEVEHPGSADDVLISEPPEPVGIGQRSCTKENDCIDHCECKQGKCMQPPLLPGPPPPYDMCDEAPTRACNSNAQCQSGCLCQAGVCTDDGVGAVNPSCHLPPPDVYEVDNTWQQWKAYGGPQIHNFHHAGDEDWIAVYFGGAGTVSIRTVDLWSGTDPKLEVYKFLTEPKPNGARGPLVGSHDDMGGQWFDPDSKGARVDIQVAAGSAYLIRVINKTPQSSFDKMYYFPTYTLNMWYL